MAFYITCPMCGANLDCGERCDCQEARADRDRIHAPVNDILARPMIQTTAKGFNHPAVSAEYKLKPQRQPIASIR